jgi:cell division septum initiation protein DivIVA
MAAGEQGLTASIDAGRIREPGFSTVRRGYDRKQVLEYLSLVADGVEALQTRTRHLESDLAEARRKKEASFQGQATREDPYEGLSAHVAELMRTFDHDVDRLRMGAETEAERLLAEARRETDHMRSDAHTSAEEERAFAERTFEDAQKNARQALGDLATQREALVTELRTIRDHLLVATRTLDAITGEEAPGDKVVVVDDASNGERATASSFPTT